MFRKTIPCPECKGKGERKYSQRHDDPVMQTCRHCLGKRTIFERRKEQTEFVFCDHEPFRLRIEALEAEARLYRKAADNESLRIHFGADGPTLLSNTQRALERIKNYCSTCSVNGDEGMEMAARNIVSIINEETGEGSNGKSNSM